MSKLFCPDLLTSCLCPIQSWSRQLFDCVVPMSSGYFLSNGLLMRRWVPYGENVAGGVVEQVVLPVKYKQSVLKTAHDSTTGHMGVRKTYDRVLLHFF